MYNIKAKFYILVRLKNPIVAISCVDKTEIFLREWWNVLSCWIINIWVFKSFPEMYVYK